MPILDAADSLQRIDTTPSLEVDVASNSRGGRTFGWIVRRQPLGDFKSGIGTTAIPIAADGSARGPLESLASERAPGPGIEPLHHAWAAVSKWGDGFALVASVGASGDLFDDSGILAWFVSDPSATSLPKPVRMNLGQSNGGDVVGLSDGSIVVAYMPETSPPRAPYALVKVTPDGTVKALPAADLGVAIMPSPPRLAPFEAGFVLVYSAQTATAPDYVPGFLTIKPHDAAGEEIVSGVIEDAIDLRNDDPIAVAFSAADRALHVAWSTTEPDGRVRVMHQRFVCRGYTGDPG
jgi:hypothetical protein